MKRQAAEAEGEAAEIGLLASRRNGPSQQINAPTINTTTADVCGSTADPVKGGEKELGIQDEENRKSKGTLPVINWSAGSKDSIQDETKSDTYISNYDETTGHERDELKEADLETGNKRVPATFGKQTRKQLRSSHKRRRSLESKEKKLGIQNDGEFSLEDEENLKSKGTLPVINWSAGSKDSLQDQTKNGTFISNYDETTGHGRDELMKEADLETENKTVPATFRKQTRKQRRKRKRRRSLLRKERELGDDNHITKGDELKVVDHLETENKRVPSSSDLEVLSITDHELNMMYDLSCSAAPSTGIRIRSRTSFREPNPALPAPCRLLGEPQVHSLPAPWRTPGALLAGSLENPRCTPCRLPAGSSLSINIPCNFNPGIIFYFYFEKY